MILQHALHQIYNKWHRAPYILGLLLWLVLSEVSTNHFNENWLIFVLISGAFSLLITQGLTEWAKVVDPSEPTLIGFFIEWFLTNLALFSFIAWLTLTPLRFISGHPGFILENWSIWIVVSILSALSTVLNLLYLNLQGFLSTE